MNFVPDGTGEFDLHVVAVGASAGGLEALEGLFSAVVPPTRMAFVVLQHLSPDFDSQMEQLLGRHTTLRVRVAENGMAVEADTIYLLPPSQEMIIVSGKLLLTPKVRLQGLSLPIDHFMRSLATDAGQRGVAIILSGSGSDGTRGACEVAAAGGLVLCQEPTTARFDSMPQSVLATGVTSLALPVDEMPAVLRHYIFDRLSPARAVTVFGRGLSGRLGEVIDLLRGAYDIDFSHYRSTTIERRLQRRMGLARIEDIDAYLECLRADPEELTSLYHDLLIGVTEFFRDPEIWARLENDVIPALFDEAGERDAEVRVWCAGCATGEEAYSLAMLLLEQQQERPDSPKIKVFASDVHRPSLEFATMGVYVEDALAKLSPERRKRWFIDDGGRCRVSAKLRRAVVFAPHDVITDAPFTRLDLIACRNLLIYLEPAVQRKVLSLYHFGLRPGGVLWLGPSESPSPSEIAEELETIDRRGRIYRKLRNVRVPLEPRGGHLRGHARSRLGGSQTSSDPQIAEVLGQLLHRYMPAALLLDESYQLLHSFGGAHRYLQFPAGRPTKHVLDLIGAKLKITVSGALQHAEKDGRPVRYVGLHDPEQSTRFDLRVEHLVDVTSGFRGFLVVFEDAGPGQPSLVESPSTEVADANASAEKLSEDYIGTLESELRYTRENLQATVEELETSNEELQASNEELQASNEELQSTNEELHSVNEELYTVNSEYQRKIEELSQAHSDIDNLLVASEVGVVFLDRNLRIRRFTHRAAELFGLVLHDVGREFVSFALRVDHRDLLADARQVLERGGRVAREVRDRSGARYLLRLLPYVDADGEHDEERGVLVTLVGIEEVRRSQEQRRRLEAIVEASEDAISSQDLDGTITTWNTGGAKLLGRTEAEVVGRPHSELVPESLRSELESAQLRARTTENTQSLESQYVASNGDPIEVSITMTPLFETGRMVGLATTARDIRSWSLARERLQRGEAQRELFLATLSHELRNPLAALHHASRVLDEDIGTDTRARANESIRRQVEHMARLLDDLLDVSRIRQGQIEMRPEPIRVGSLIDGVREVAESLMSVRSLELSIAVEDPDQIIVVDADRVRQVLYNLLSNAAKFTPRGRRVSVSCRCEPCDDDARGPFVIEVRDEGRGLSRDELDEVFEPFVQGRLGRKQGGLGLGLALVRSIIEAHGGEVEADSDGVEQGAVFTVWLPGSCVRDDIEPIHARSVAANSGVRPRAIGRRLTLVEDNDDGRTMLTTLLRAHGFEVTGAVDGPSGLAKILDVMPDVAIIDIGLPGMSGLDIARHVRERLGSSIVLIALTGYGQQSDREAVLEAGFDHHLVKPIDTQALETALLYSRSEPDE